MPRLGIVGSGLGLGHGGVPLTGGGALSFADTFTRSDGVLGAPWLGGSTWQIVSGKAVNTPTLGAELLTNGNFAAWTADNPDGWTVGTESATEQITQNPAGKCQILTTGALIGMFQPMALAVGNWWRYAYTVAAVAAGGIKSGDEVGGAEYNPPAPSTAGNKLGIFRVAADAGTIRLYIYRNSGNTDITIDDVSAKQLTLASLFQAINAGTPNVDVSAAATIVAGTQAGVVVCLDSLSSPANFVIGYHDGVNAKLESCTNGVYATLVTAAVAYSAGAAVRVVKNGTVCKLYYGASQVGADQTVAGMTGTLHGMFSTSELNSLDAFSVTAV